MFSAYKLYGIYFFKQPYLQNRNHFPRRFQRFLEDKIQNNWGVVGGVGVVIGQFLHPFSFIIIAVCRNTSKKALCFWSFSILNKIFTEQAR